MNEEKLKQLHAFGFMYHDVPYETRLEMCLDLLRRCDKMVVLSELSKGVRAEVKYCIDNAKPYVFKEEL